jgi:NAD(P)-dependent dehydrogenase (short-subunit alcohol dehydrogenase family)
MNRFVEQTAFISDGSSGIGLAIAKEYIAEGGKVIITGTTESLGKALPELGPQAFGIAADASNIKAIFKLKEIVAKISPSIDMLFINAGLANTELLEDVTEEYFDQHFTSIVKGPYFIIQQLFPLLSERGSIILNSSINAGIEGASLYEAAQSTLINSLSEELLSKNIRVHVFNPVLASTQVHGKQGFDAEQLDHLAYSIKWMITSENVTDPMMIASLN